MVERADTSSCSAGNPAGGRRFCGAILAALMMAVCALAAAPAAPQTLPSTSLQGTLGVPPPQPGAPARGPQGQKLPPTWNGLVLWSVPLDDSPSTPPAVDAKLMYAPLKDGSLVAVDHRTGSPVWIVPRTASVPPITVDDLLVGADGAELWALAASTGEPRWTRTLGAAVVQAPAGDTGRVVVVTDAQELLLVRADDGTVVFQLALGSPVTAAPVLLGNTGFVGTADGRVVAVDLTAGQLAWTRKLNGRVLVLTALPDRLLAGGTDDYFYSLDPKDGDTQWLWRVGGDVNTPAAADPKGVYFVSMDNMLRALDRRRGNMLWQRPLGSRPVGGPLLIKDFVVLAQVSPELRCFDILTGSPACIVGLPGRALHRPAVPTTGANTMLRLVYLSGGGQAVAVGPSPEPPLEKWIKVPGSTLPAEVAPISPLPSRAKRNWPEADLVKIPYAPGRLLPPEWDPVAPLPVRGLRSWPEPDLVKWTSVPGRVLPPETLGPPAKPAPAKPPARPRKH